MSVPCILTNHPGRGKSKTWSKLTHCPVFESTLSRNILSRFLVAWALFRLRSGYRVVVLGGGAQIDIFYMILQRLWPFNSRPIVKIDCLWYESSPLKQFFKRCLFKWLDKVVNRYVVWASREINDYARAFGLPLGKFSFIPYHTTPDFNASTVRNGDYLFSGGNFARDYSSLARAVKGLDLKVIVACTNSKALNAISFPSNVDVVGVNHQEFMQLMAGSGINVVSLAGGLLHSGGQQTFLNAMAMGKPVIVTDPEGAKDYIDNGVDGILVPPSDPERLRSAILRIHNDLDFAKSLGKAARKKARRWDTEANLAAIAYLAESVASADKGYDTKQGLNSPNTSSKQCPL